MDLAVSEGYLKELLLCIPVLGITLDKASANETPLDNRFFIKISPDIQATGAQTDNGFTVFKGSHASITERISIPSALKAKRNHLISKGILQDTGKGSHEFTTDFACGSPSTAAGRCPRQINQRPHRMERHKRHFH